jgi:hypothetical protein
VKHKTIAHPAKRKNNKRRWLIIGGGLLACLLIALAYWLTNNTPVYADAPEASKILNLQSNLPFQILIPAYLPKGFDRVNVQTTITSGPGGEPMVQLQYTNTAGADLYVRQWVPVNPDSEILAQSHPIVTSWGRGWMLGAGGLVALWVDVGPLRVSVYTGSADTISQNTILEIANTLGPPSNNQVFYFSVATPVVRSMQPAPPVEIPINEDGIQEFTLVITPGGYSPLRFSVKVGVPVRMIFRQLGYVGCGNELLFPADPTNPTALRLVSQSDSKNLEFTPQQVGEFQFYCAHQMYRGVMTVRP